MTSTRLIVVTCLWLAAPIGPHHRAAAADRSPPAARPERFTRLERPSVRTSDHRLRRLIADGMRSSETIRALVERLERSDVVAYLECDHAGLANVAGRLTFVSAAGGHRYVVIRLRPIGSRTQRLAILAHELRHAVEIADAPGVVDDASLVVEYERIGHLNRWSAVPGIAFDSEAAIRAGQEVLQELAGMAAD
jgi:hypothetical protein